MSSGDWFLLKARLLCVVSETLRRADGHTRGAPVPAFHVTLYALLRPTVALSDVQVKER